MRTRVGKVGAETSVGLTTATARAMLGNADQTGGRVSQLAQRFGDAIRLGLILDGERLPPEAQLSEQLGVATATLREALVVLREQGLVTTKRGRGGGNFVRSIDTSSSGSLHTRLAEFTVNDLRELGDHRAAISSMSARLAALRSTDGEIDKLRRQVDRLRVATTPSARRRADTQFTIEVAAAAQSARLVRAEMSLRAEVGDLLWLNRTDEDHESSTAARLSMVEAIADHNSDHAGEIAEGLIVAETHRLVQARLELYMRETSTRRREESS